MKVERTKDSRFQIDCDETELMIKSNAINNIRQAVCEHDHGTLIGASETEARKVLQTLVRAFRPNHG